jgi:hypothetical protein
MICSKDSCATGLSNFVKVGKLLSQTAESWLSIRFHKIAFRLNRGGPCLVVLGLIIFEHFSDSVRLSRTIFPRFVCWMFIFYTRTHTRTHTHTHTLINVCFHSFFLNIPFALFKIKNKLPVPGPSYSALESISIRAERPPQSLLR